MGSGLVVERKFLDKRSDDNEKTIISSGISKWCGAGGWRLGTLIFPKQLNLVKK